MHSEPIGNPRARAANCALVLCCLIAAVLAGACAAPSVIRATPPASPEALVTQPAPGVGSPTSTPEPDVSDARQIERVAFATRIDSAGGPVEETSVFAESPGQMYLCVQLRDVELGTSFRAYWFENGQIIGQSDALATRDDEIVWVALVYRPIAALSPTSEYSVELQVDEQTVDRFVFRVGVGDADDVVAQAAFATGFDAAGKPVDIRRIFADDTAELQLLARISRQIDPRGMLFTSIWYRGDTAIAYVNPVTLASDDVESTATPTTATATETPGRASTVLAFTYKPNGKLPRGNYRVSLLLNGTEVRSIPFVVGDATVAEKPEEPADVVPVEPDDPNDRAAESEATLGQLVITADVDANNEPTEVNIWVWEGPVRTTQALFATFSVSNLAQDDDVTLTFARDDEVFDTRAAEHEALDTGWIATEFEISMPRRSGRMYTYTVVVQINGESVAERTFEVWAVSE